MVYGLVVKNGKKTNHMESKMQIRTANCKTRLGVDLVQGGLRVRLTPLEIQKKIYVTFFVLERMRMITVLFPPLG